MKKKTSSPSQEKESPTKKLGGQPENDQDARDAGVESATSARKEVKRTKTN
jgi:hypothetical protein